VSRARTLDELARRLAEPMPRSRAVRLIGTALAAAAAPGISPRLALAAPRGGSDTGPSVCPGTQICSTYIDPNAWTKGQKTKCCPFPAQQWSCGADGWTCLDTCAAAGKAIGKKTTPTWSAERLGGTDPNLRDRPKRYDCCPVPDTIPSDGECLPNCEHLFGPGARNCGKECCPPNLACREGGKKCGACLDDLCGGVCCSAQLGSWAPFCCGRSRETGTCCGPEQAKKENKEVCNEFALQWNHFAAEASIASAALGKLSAGAGLVAGAISGVAWKANAVLSSCAADPPDRRFKSIARPPKIGAASIRPGEGISVAAAGAVTNMLQNQARAYSLLAAWVSSLERSQGAALARSEKWARKQVAAAGSYASQAAGALRKDKALRLAAVSALAASGVNEVTLTVQDVQEAQAALAANGLPASVSASLRLAGFRGADSARIANELRQADPTTLAGPVLLSNLRNPRHTRLASKLASELDGYAHRAKANPLGGRR
jgi:hypothetical protein